MNAPTDKNSLRPPYKYVGTRPVRPDGIDKVTGRAVYGTDFVAPGMLHGAVLRSPYAHARIKGIDARKALALPGVKAVVTGADFPAEKIDAAAGGEAGGNLGDVSVHCMARDKALYAGHAVAAVAATTVEIAQAALKLIEVDYEELPFVTSLSEAIKPDAPLVYEDMITKGVEPAPTKPSNLTNCFRLARGDVDAGLGDADVVVSGHYETALVHQGYIEPHTCVASWASDGQCQMWISSQGGFDLRNMTAGVLKMPVANLRVFQLEIGGGFGGKTSIYLEPVTVLLSKKAGRPVRLAMNRQEVFVASNPAPASIIDIKIGAKKDGTITGIDTEMWTQSGAFPGSIYIPAAMTVMGIYNTPNARTVSWDVVTNTTKSGAYRAPGAPPINYAIESALDDLAMKLGIDPIDLRIKNAVRPGDMGPFAPHGEIGFVETLEAAKASPHYNAPLPEGQSRGVSAGWWGNHGGISTAQVSLADDGTVMVTTGNPDIGGSRASMALMAAETLGVPYENVRVAIADTNSIGYSMLTGGSRVTFATGMAVTDACKKVIETLVERGTSILGAEAGTVVWRDGAAHAPDGSSVTIAQIAGKSGQFSGTIAAEASVNPHTHLAGFGVHICDAEVDAETGVVKLTRYTAVHDVGTAIHPDYVEGQIQGGATQGIGWALNEAYVYDSKGRLDNAGFLDYRMPVCSDMPMVDAIMVEKPNPAHPYGVKGIGEPPIVPPLGAVSNAVSRALGQRMTSLPLSPDRVWRAAQGK